MVKIHRLAAPLLASLALSGCVSLADLGLDTAGLPTVAPPPAAALPPAPPPVYAPGDSFVFDDNGVVTQEQVVSVSPDRIVWTNDSGLIWTKDTSVVTPQLSWSTHPELGRGRQTIVGNPDLLFPLREGNVTAYTVRGSAENAPTGWQDEHRCVVAGQETLEVKAGRFTTYKIDCQRKDYLDTYYYSPVVQNYVLRNREFSGRTVSKELISVRLADDRAKGMPTAVVPEQTPIDAKPMEPKPLKSMADGHGDDHAKDMKDDHGGNKMMMKPSGQETVMMNTVVARLETVISKLERIANMQTAGMMKMEAASPTKKPGHDKMGHSDKMEDKMDKPSGKWAIHLASYRSQKAAVRGWSSLTKKFSQLNEYKRMTSEFDPGKGRGTYVRLLAVGFQSRKEATSFCRPIKAKKQYCDVRGPLP